MPKSFVLVSLVIVVAVVLALLFAAPALDPAQYQALAGGLQAFFVAVGLTVAGLTLLSDSHDRRVDRVLHLSEMLTTGEVNDARERLISHRRKCNDEGKRSISIDDLDDEESPLSAYKNQGDGRRPRSDSRIVLRYMQRVNAARRSGAVDPRLLHELLGSHAVWWRRAFELGPDRKILNPLIDLADWANSFAETLKGKRNSPSYLDTWGDTRRRDFGPNPERGTALDVVSLSSPTTQKEVERS